MTRISRNRRSRLRRRSFSRKPRTPSDSGRRISARCRDAQFNFRTGMELTPDRQFTAHKFGSFVHARQAPVSRAAVVGQNLFVHACPIIANSHLQLVLVIVDLRFGPPRLRVPEGVARCLAGNAVHFVAQYGVKIPRSALHLNGKLGGVLVCLVGKPFTESFQGHGEIVSLCRGRAQTLHGVATLGEDRKSTRLNSSHVEISYAVFCLKKKKKKNANAYLKKKKSKNQKK